MSYIANSLAPHERLVLEARFPWLLRAAAWTALIGLALAPTLSWVVLALLGRAGPAWGYAAAGVGALGLVVFAWLQLYMIFTETGVTDQRFVLKRGVVARHATDFPLQALENVDVDQSVLARLFGFGRLTIAGAGETQLRTPPMQDPVSFRTALAEARIALNDAPAYRAQAVRIDPMSRAHARPVDERARGRHLGREGARKRRAARPEGLPGDMR